MKRVWRVVRVVLLLLAALVAVLAALFAYFLYTPAGTPPVLSGVLRTATMDVGGVTRHFQVYVPRSFVQGAPLVLVLHGSGENVGQIREGTGHGFERLADQHGFALAYPESKAFDWNDCSVVGDYRAGGVPVDDIGFLTALAARLVRETGAGAGRVFVAGVSAGGSMALRLALEAPGQFRAVAAVAANIPTPDNFKCRPQGKPAPVLIMNGTADPLVPYNGGEINLLGLFYKAGTVRSSSASGQFLADLGAPGRAPLVQSATVEGVRVERHDWQGAGSPVALVTIHGGGHGLPQPYQRRARLLGPSPMAPDGPALIWSFFSRADHIPRA